MAKDSELFGEIIYLPGNHDHHLWETARENQYLNHVRRLAPGARLDRPWHTTKIFMDMRGKDRLANLFLTTVAQRAEHLRHAGFEILTAYPNYGIRQNGRCVVFHHGHFIECLYRLMSTASSLVFGGGERPASVYELEEQNFAWIDFFWSTMGRSGTVGTGVERIYESTQDEGSLQAITDTLAANVARKYDLPGPGTDWLEEKALQALLRAVVVQKVVRKQERQQTGPGHAGVPLTASSLDGLRWYIEELLPRQVKQERGQMPDSMTFVFGHTHKLFQAVMTFRGYSQGVQLFNTGGWIVESVAPEPLRGGAIALGDEELNTVNLRMYNEGDYVVRADEPVAHGAPPSGFCRYIDQIVKQRTEPWRSFSATAAVEVARRAEYLRARLARRA